MVGSKSEARGLVSATQVGRYEKELVDLNNFIARKAHLEKELEDTRTDLLRRALLLPSARD